MEPIRTKVELLQAITASGLFSDEQLMAARFSIDEGESLRVMLDHFVSMHWLTSWQAEHLLAGRSAFQIGGCNLLDFLGRGRMGLVFRAEQRLTGRIVAVKIMAKELLADERSVKRFLREIRLIARISHPNVVAAYDAGQLKDGRYYLVTEYVPGHDLSKWMACANPLPVDWACECAFQACLGLQHVAEKELIHRDIKPSNIVAVGKSVGHCPTVKILDLGLGRFAPNDGEDGQLTRDGYALGTFEYAAPEQIRDAHKVDNRADIFSLGMTLFQLLTGRLPFERENLADKLTAKFLEDAPPVSDLRSDIPPGLSRVVSGMLHRDVKQRPKTPLEAANMLRPFAMSRGSAPVVRQARSESGNGEKYRPADRTNPSRKINGDSPPF